MLRYLVDTNLFVISWPSDPRPWVSVRKYKLDADSGDTWLIYTDSSYNDQERAVVRDTYLSYVLGKLTMVKEIDYYKQFLGDTSLWGTYHETDHIASGFGFIFQYKDGDQWPTYMISGAIINHDTSGTISTLEQIKSIKPKSFKLRQNYPNPFNPSTTIDYALPKTSQVQFTIYNTLGQVVKQVSYGSLPAGNHQYTWDGQNESGANLASGLYILHFNALSLDGEKQTFDKTIKLILIR